MPIGFLNADPRTKPDAGAELDRSHALARGLAGLWLFNEGTGGPRDLVTGLRGSLVGSSSWSGGNVANNATNDSIDTGGFQDISGAAGTVSWRFAPGFAPNDGVAHYCLGHSDGTNEFVFLKYSNNNIYAGWAVGADYRATTAATSAILAAGVARTYSIAWDASGTTLYCNGASVATSAAPTTAAIGYDFHWGNELNSFVTSGAGAGTAWHWGMIHRRRLSGAEVATLHSEPFAPILAPTTRRLFAASGGGADTTAPVVLNANVDAAGTTLTVNFTEAGSPPVLPATGATGLTFSPSGGSNSISGIAISGTTLTATISRTILSSETCTISYTPGNITDSAATPNALASFSGFSVTNNSTQTPALTAGVASFDSSGPAGGSPFIKLTATAASSGIGSKTYQWQRNTDGGSYGNLGGATSLTLTDTTATAGHLYGYKVVATDTVPNSVTSNAVTAQVYTGGALTGTTTYSRGRVVNG